MLSIKRKLNSLGGRLTRRFWGAETIDKYVGTVEDVYLTHTTDPSLRTRSASGATVTGILINGLETGSIDGALVCRTVVRNGVARGEFYIATNRQELLESRGSIYVAVSFARQALPLIEKFPGTLAVVGLPCHVDILRRRMKRDADIESKVACIIGLICGHSSQTDLVDSVTERLKKRVGGELTGYHFRHGHWRGQLSAKFDNRAEVELPFSEFSLYQNLYFWSEKKCFQCTDHFGYRADISAGDVWSLNLRNDPVKHTSILARTKVGQEFIDSTRQTNTVAFTPLDIREVLDGQARTAPFHYNISARISAARRYDLRLKDTVHEPVHWNHRLVAEMAMFNWAWSQHPKYSKLIMRLPRPLLKAYLYLFKALESF